MPDRGGSDAIDDSVELSLARHRTGAFQRRSDKIAHKSLAGEAEAPIRGNETGPGSHANRKTAIAVVIGIVRPGGLDTAIESPETGSAAIAIGAAGGSAGIPGHISGSPASSAGGVAGGPAGIDGRAACIIAACEDSDPALPGLLGP